MARKVGNRKTKSQGGIRIIGEGMTEWYYLQSIKGLISSDISPKVREHKDGIGYIEKKNSTNLLKNNCITNKNIIFARDSFRI